MGQWGKRNPVNWLQVSFILILAISIFVVIVLGKERMAEIGRKNAESVQIESIENSDQTDVSVNPDSTESVEEKIQVVDEPGPDVATETTVDQTNETIVQVPKTGTPVSTKPTQPKGSKPKAEPVPSPSPSPSSTPTEGASETTTTSDEPKVEPSPAPTPIEEEPVVTPQPEEPEIPAESNPQGLSN